MKIRLLAVGTKMPDWVDSGFKEYSKRMPPELRVELIEVQTSVKGRNPSPQPVENQGRALLKHIDRRDFVVALDVLGKMQVLLHQKEILLNFQNKALLLHTQMSL